MNLNCNHSDILRQRTQDVEVKKYFISLLEKFGSFSHTRRTLEKLDAEARAEVAKLGGNPVLEDVLDEMLDWKRNTDEKTQNSEDPVLPWVMSVLFMGGWLICVIHICYCYSTGLLKQEKRSWEMFVHIFVQHGHSLWCQLHAEFVIKCYSVYVK